MATLVFAFFLVADKSLARGLADAVDDEAVVAFFSSVETFLFEARGVRLRGGIAYGMMRRL
jgi:hypothetical protein